MGAWHDQWWRIRDALTLGRVATAAAVVLAIVGGYQLTRIDWAAYGPAEPPENLPTIDNSLVTLRSVRLGDFEALRETPSFTWSQFVPVTIEAESVPDRFHVSNSKRRSGKPAKSHNLLRCSLGLEIVRRSSLGDGSEVAYMVVSGAKVNRDNEMTWKSKTWIPHVPGDYRVRVVLHTSYRDADNVRHIAGPIVVGTFQLHVLPGEPAA